MDKKILNEELQQMKYLFGYKAGKVISEQKGLLKENPATQPPPKTQPIKPGTKPQVPQPKKEANTYKIQGITASNINQFIEPSDELLKVLGLYNDPNSLNNLRKAYSEILSRTPGCTLKTLTKGTPCWDLKVAQEKYTTARAKQDYYNEAAQIVLRTLLKAAAELGWTPDRINSLTKNQLVSLLQTYEAPMPYTTYYATYFPDESNPIKYGTVQGQQTVNSYEQLLDSVGGDEFVQKLKQAVEMKMKELGI